MLQKLSRLWRKFATDHPCIGCQQNRVYQGVCFACYDSLKLHTQESCEYCAKPVIAPHTECLQCQLNPPDFDRCSAIFDYTYPVAEWLHACKYQKRIELAHILAECLCEGLPQTPPGIDIIIAMPLDQRKQSIRGFNLAEIFAKKLSTHWHIPMLNDAVTRSESSQAQAGLSFEERQKNIKGIFKVNASVYGASIALIDDVLTTGATLSELSKTLKKEGASWIEAWVFARA
jgi:ComF family protein